MNLIHQGNYRFRFFDTKTPDFPLHLHNAVEIVFMKKGRCDALYQNKRYHLAEGDALFVFPNQIHGYENSYEAESFVLIVPMTKYLESFGNLFHKKIPVSPKLESSKLRERGISKLFFDAYLDTSGVDSPILRGYVLILIGKLIESMTLTECTNTESNALSDALIYLNKNYRSPLRRKDIALAIGYNESYLSHIFSEMLNTTLTDWITALRINDAIDMLANGEQAISQIAMSLGFGSIRSFNRAFKAAMKLSPSEYRKKARSISKNESFSKGRDA